MLKEIDLGDSFNKNETSFSLIEYSEIFSTMFGNNFAPILSFFKLYRGQSRNSLLSFRKKV